MKETIFLLVVTLSSCSGDADIVTKSSGFKTKQLCESYRRLITLKNTKCMEIELK